ncbi:hypothetical protein MCOR25_009022 [Pyricularia grisea]|nr:hypothetical protein MCOR25_009022 [Pyricularia grisea]
MCGGLKRLFEEPKDDYHEVFPLYKLLATKCGGRDPFAQFLASKFRETLLVFWKYMDKEFDDAVSEQDEGLGSKVFKNCQEAWLLALWQVHVVAKPGDKYSRRLWENASAKSGDQSIGAGRILNPE